MTEVPVISITLDETDDRDDDDSQRPDIADCHTDIEELESDTSRKNSLADGLKGKCGITDVEDFDDSGDNEDVSEKSYGPEISLNEYLDQGVIEESSNLTGNQRNKLASMQSVNKSPSPTAFRLAIVPDYGGITDCEDLEASDDEHDENEKVYSDDEKPIVLEGSSDIHDSVNGRQKFEKFAPKIIQPDSSGHTSSESEEEKPKLRLNRHKSLPKRGNRIQDAKSDTENIFFSDDDKRKARKAIPLILETPDVEVMAFEGSDIEDPPQYPEINISFVAEEKSKKKTKRKSTPAPSAMLGLPANQDEGHTDVENLNSSDDDDEPMMINKTKQKSFIPIAIIKSDALTDVEDFGETSGDDCDSDDKPELPLPSPTRELTFLIENKTGEPMKQTTPLPDNILLGFHDLDADKGLTDVEDFSDEGDDDDDWNETPMYTIECIPDLDGGVVTSSDHTSGNNNSPRPSMTPEPLTDCEDIFVKRQDGRRRRTKPKHSQTRPKSNFLDTKIYVESSSAGAHTDVEDLDVDDDDVLLKDKSLKKHRRATVDTTRKPSTSSNADGKTDTECVSGDESIDLSQFSPDIRASLIDFQIDTCTLTSFRDSVDRKSSSLVELKLPEVPRVSLSPENFNASTDIEDHQCQSENEEGGVSYSRAQTATPMQLNRDLEELSTSEIHEVHSRAFDREHQLKFDKFGSEDTEERDSEGEKGDDDLLNLIQTEAITLVDSILEESVTVVNNNSSTFNQSSFSRESDDYDECQLIDENIYDQQQQQQQQFQLPLINVNNYSINLDQAHSDEISDNFAIKSDCDIIVKSPTIESMSGKSFEDVDDEYNFTSSAFNDVNPESSLSNNTATNITTTSPIPVPPQQPEGASDSDDDSSSSSEEEFNAQAEILLKTTQSLIDEVLQDTILDESSSSSSEEILALAENLLKTNLDSDDSISDEVQAKAHHLVDEVLQTTVATVENCDIVSDVKKSVSFPESDIAVVIPISPAPTVSNIAEPTLKRVERKFEHLSSEVREDEDPDSVDLEEIGFINKEDISALQSDFSKISWDESLSATTGDFGSSTPDNDLQDVLSFPERKLPSVDIPKPTPRLTKSSTNDTNYSSMSSDVDGNSMSSTSLTINNQKTDSEQNASDEHTTSSDSFQRKKQFWESFDHPILPQPIPKPRIAGQVKDSFDTDTSSLRSMPESKQVSRDDEDRLEDESFPISERYDSDASEQKEEVIRKPVTDMDKIDDVGASETDDESAAGFYIGESSRNVIKKTFKDFGVDNEGYQHSIDVQESEIISHLKEIQENVMAISAENDIKVELAEKSEFEVSEKLSRQQSEEKEIPAKSQPIIHSPIKNETSFEMEKPLELAEEHVTPAKASAIEVMKSSVESEPKKPLKFENFTEVSSKDSYRFDSKMREEEFEKTLEEVEDSLDAVQEELIEVVKDGKLIKQSPSEFEINILPDLKYPASIPEQEELPETPKKEPIVKIQEPEAAKSKLSEAEESQLSSNDESFNKLDVVHRKGQAKQGSNRWSATDIESSSESHYQSFERTDSRPLSSDVENLIQYQSSEYETAHDQSQLPGSTLEYHSAVGTLNSTTISSRDSMKSLDSESSGNLASMEASEVSETLVPSTMEECEEHLQTDLLSHDTDFEDKDNKYTSLESEATQSEDVSPPIAPLMKRSHEMNFAPDIRPIVGSVDLLDETKYDEKLARSVEDLKYGSWEEHKLGSSLEEGSMLSISMSSASNLETMVEIHEHADMMGSLVGSFDSAKIYTTYTDDASGMTPPDHDITTRVESLTMTTTTVQEQDQFNVNTQITTTSSDETNETLKKRGHKRTDSTSVFAGGFIKAGSKESSDSFEEDLILQEDSSDVISSEKDETHGESSDSEYDRYESEYARSFRTPGVPASKSKAKDEEKKSFSPGQSVIETIVEDVHAEIELSTDHVVEKKPSIIQDIPNIQVTEDLVQDEEEQEQEEAKSLPPVIAQTVHYAKQVEYKMTEEEYQDILAKKYKSRLEDITKSYDDNIYEEDQQPSPGSDSFEMLNEPDLSDEFVIVEEVAKEAQETDQEGKSLSIQQQKYVRKHDEDMEKYIVKSAPAATDAGSTFATTDINFEFEDSPPQDEEGDVARGGNGYSLEGSKRWVEMNLSDPANLRYPYEMDRGILEDIKEEDTDFEVGSSRISSFKDSYSSTPDYEVLVRKLQSGREHDNISMNSLQEFESLEHVISLENRQKQTQSSQESLSNGSYPKRGVKGVHGDDISLSSLKEFEGLENACLEAHLIEIRAKEEAALLLSRSDDSSKSSGSSNGAKSSPKSSTSPSGGKVTSTTTVVTSTVVKGKPSSHLEQQMAQEFVKLQQRAQEIMEDNSISIMEASIDSLEDDKSGMKQIFDKTSSQHVSSDSLDKLLTNDPMTSSVDSIEASKGGATGKSSDVDSIENNSPVKRRSDSIDSIELQFAASQGSRMERDSIDDTMNFEVTLPGGGKRTVTQTITKTVTSQPAGASGQTSTVTSTVHYDMPARDISSDSLNRTDPEMLLTSTESIETSSTSTNATYRNASEMSQMSGSMTSCDSNTMIDTFPDFYSPSSSSHQIHQTTTTTTYAFKENENLLDDDDLAAIARTEESIKEKSQNNAAEKEE